MERKRRFPPVKSPEPVSRDVLLENSDDFGLMRSGINEVLHPINPINDATIGDRMAQLSNLVTNYPQKTHNKLNYLLTGGLAVELLVGPSYSRSKHSIDVVLLDPNKAGENLEIIGTEHTTPTRKRPQIQYNPTLLSNTAVSVAREARLISFKAMHPGIIILYKLVPNYRETTSDLDREDVEAIVQFWRRGNTPNNLNKTITQAVLTLPNEHRISTLKKMHKALGVKLSGYLPRT